MKASKGLSRFKNLVTKQTVAKEFTDMIREDDSIFWSKPKGNSADFHRAFHSKKTHKALRYVMAVAGILGEENALSRSLAGLKSKLHFKVEPQYVRHGGRLKLSHFEVKGYSPAGYGEYLKINTVAKRMMMGTPSDPPRVRYGVSAMTNDRRLTREYAKKIEGGYAKQRKRHLRDQKIKSRNAKMSQEKLQKEIARLMIDDVVLTPENYADQLLAILEKDDEEEEIIEKPVKKKKKKKKGKKGKKKQEEEVEVAHRRPTRKLTKTEKKRILKAYIEISKHLQGIMWIMHWTIKLNDVRRKFIYIDENYVPVDPSTYNYDLSHKCWIELHGFPEHAHHYRKQHVHYREGFKFAGLEEEEDIVYYAILSCEQKAYKLQGEAYTDEEWMQDDIDELLDFCSECLYKTSRLYDEISNGFWLMHIRVVKHENKVPVYVHKHTRHTTKNKAFNPKVKADEAKAKVSRYKMIHGDYGNKQTTFNDTF